MRPTKTFTKANLLKIKVMADNGFGAVPIAHAIGSTPASVRNKCSEMKIKLGRTKGTDCSAERFIISVVSEASFLELDRHARQREISVQTLAVLLLETIAKDNLFDAVLDRPLHRFVHISTIAVHRLYAVPDLRERARRRVCPHRPGNDVAATCGNCGDFTAMIRIAPEQKGSSRLRPYHCGKLPGRRGAAEVEEETEIPLRRGRLPLHRLRDRRLDDAQEINYRPIMKALADVGYTGYVGQEFIPTRDPLAGLKEAVALCTV